MKISFYQCDYCSVVCYFCGLLLYSFGFHIGIWGALQPVWHHMKVTFFNLEALPPNFRYIVELWLFHGNMN